MPNCCRFAQHSQVKNFGHHRAVDPDSRSGVEALRDRLAEYGYVCDWTTLCSSNVFLPQERPRVYMIALLSTPFAAAAVQQLRVSQLQEAMALLRRLFVPGPPEDLTKLLDGVRRAAWPAPTQVPAVPEGSLGNTGHGRGRGRGRGSGRSRGGGLSPGHGKRSCGRRHTSKDEAAAPTATGSVEPPPAWIEDNARYARAHIPFALTGQSAFAAMDSLQGLLPRALDVLFIRLTLWAIKHKRPWDKERGLVADPSQSIKFCSVLADRFPCVTPQGTFVVMQQGQAHIASGFDCLALQGVQQPEVARWNLHDEDQGLLQNLAGNSFTANVLAAVLLAGLSAIDLLGAPIVAA